jgi:hypothetical protein
VARVTHGVRALLAGQREVVVRRHPGDDEARVAVDLQELADEEALGTVRAVGDERRVERHGAG